MSRRCASVGNWKRALGSPKVFSWNASFRDKVGVMISDTSKGISELRMS